MDDVRLFIYIMLVLLHVLSSAVPLSLAIGFSTFTTRGLLRESQDIAGERGQLP